MGKLQDMTAFDVEGEGERDSKKYEKEGGKERGIVGLHCYNSYCVPYKTLSFMSNQSKTYKSRRLVKVFCISATFFIYHIMIFMKHSVFSQCNIDRIT